MQVRKKKPYKDGARGDVELETHISLSLLVGPRARVPHHTLVHGLESLVSRVLAIPIATAARIHPQTHLHYVVVAIETRIGYRHGGDRHLR